VGVLYDRHMRGSLRRKGAGFVALLMVAMLFAGGCSRRPRYSQETPDDVIKSAVAMIKNGDTRKLASLIYADSPEMRGVLNQFGRMLESMQKLSVASAQRFPAEFAKLQEDAAAAAEDPKNKTLIASMMAGLGDFTPKPGQRPPNADDIRAGFSAVLADPFGWIDRNAARLSTVKTADDTAAVMFDGQPAIPVVGLPMRMEGGKWYVVLPVNVPPVSNVMPRTRQQWSIFASVFKVLENSSNAVTDEVRAGRVSSLKNLVDKYQEKVLLPIGIAFVAYGKELDVRGRTERRMNALKTRERAWVEARKKKGAEGSPGVSPKLIDAINTLAPAKIEQIVRADKPLGIDKMSDPDFEDFVGGWLREAGLSVAMEGDLSAASVDGAVAKWQAERAAKAAAGKGKKR